jgi:hypothetical protein
MNYRRFNEEKKNAKQDFEALRRECFTEEEIKRCYRSWPGMS